MPNITIGFGVLLCALGLFGYFRAAADHRSITALIPLFFGAALILLAVLAYSAAWRRHAMHAAAAVGLVGFLAGAGRGLSKIGNAISDDPTLHRAPRMALLMGIVCLIFVGFCIGSFISARRRRKAESGSAT